MLRPPARRGAGGDDTDYAPKMHPGTSTGTALRVTFTSRENERRLMEEAAEAEILDETLASSMRLTGEMVAMLNSFETRLLNFEKSILPIHRTTQRLNRFYENINKTLSSTSRLIEYFDVADREQKLLALGPVETNLEPYLESLRRIGDALHALSESRISSAERAIYKLRQQHNLGVVQLTQLYKKWLTAISSPLKDISKVVAPTASIATATAIFDSTPPPDEAILLRLGGLAAWLNTISIPFDPESHPRKIYPAIRGTYIDLSLRPLAAVAISDVKTCSTVFIHVVIALTALLRDEHVVLKGALDFETPDTWAPTVTPAIATVIETGNAVLQIIKRRNDFSLIFMLFDVLEFWSVQREKLHVHLAEISGRMRALDALFDTWTIAALRVIPDFLEEVKTPAKGTGPPDATVHESTSNTMSFLKKLLEYPDSTESVLMTIGEKDWGTPGLNITDIKYVKSKGELTKKYFETILGHLENNLEFKSKQYKKSTYGIIFLVNNINYLHKSLRSNARSPASLIEHFAKALRGHRNNLVDAIAKPLLAQLMDVTVIQDGAVKTNMSSSERNTIKEKFKTFNTSLEDTSKVLRAATIPDAELKAALVNEICTILVPMYERFYNRYANSDFTKNKDKYIKHTSSTVRIEVAGMFK